MPPIYDENSCIYIFSRKSFLKNKSRIGANPYFFKIDNLESVDIDEEFDFILAILIQLFIFPFFGLYPTVWDSIGIALIFTVFSIIRSAIWRNFFRKIK